MSAKKPASKDSSKLASKDSSKPASKETRHQPAVAKQVPQGDHINLDIWHGILPNEDTLLALKNDGDYLLRAYEHKDSFYIVLSIRWGTEVSATEAVVFGPAVARGCFSFTANSRFRY